MVGIILVCVVIALSVACTIWTLSSKKQDTKSGYTKENIVVKKIKYDVEIFRMEKSVDGTLGTVRIDNELFCTTLELPEKQNLPNISCIPSGKYTCKRVMSPKFGETFQVMDVPKRSHILFHAGNTVADTAGCILLGKYPAKLKGHRAVLNSGNTFKAFLAKFKDREEFSLIIREV